MAIIKIKSDTNSITSCYECPFVTYYGDGYEGVWRCGLTQKVIREGSPYDLEPDMRSDTIINDMQKHHDSSCPIVEITEE